MYKWSKRLFISKKNLQHLADKKYYSTFAPLLMAG